ncbi:MAG: hypothetical protein EU541_02390 [Promethearchaeota archaeon]|nr:MAG: hypothetical protein EU541_02390 [Candidatus Lokiarchaeota archaeon]
MSSEKSVENRKFNNLIEYLKVNKIWIIGLICIAIVSFSLFMISLTIYPISYGPDGAYYDINVRAIMRTGVPDTEDPPLVFYYLTFFVILVGNSYLGIKIGMALIASLMTIPAFFLTRLFTEKANVENNIICLLSAFLISINIYCYRLIEDFMKNLAGVFFLLCYIYFLVRWFEDLKNWKIYGVLTGIFFTATFFTHVFPGLLAIIILGGIFLFNLIAKSFKTRTIPKKEIIFLLILGAISLIIILILTTFYPFTAERIWNRLLNYLNSIKMNNKYEQFIVNLRVYLNIPYILGLIALLYYLYKGLRKRVDPSNKPVLAMKTFLSWVYGMIAVLLFGMMVIPTTYIDRILIMGFIPLALISPLFFIPITKYLKEKYPKKKIITVGLILGIFSAFSIISLVHVVSFWRTMGPNITMQQYNELTKIRENQIKVGKINKSGLMGVDEYHFGYWVEYVFDMEVTTSNISNIAPNYNGTELYGIYRKGQPPVPFRSPGIYPWNPLIPLKDPDIEITNKNIQTAHPSPPPSYGIVIHNGTFFEVRLLFYANGTKAT